MRKPASSCSPARNTRSHGTNTSSKITTPVDWPYLPENFAAASPGRPAGRADDRHAFGVDRHCAADGEVRVLAGHRAAGHDEEFVHVRRAGDDRLGAANDDAVLPSLLDVDVDVAVALRAGALGAVALGVGHGDAEGEILVLNTMQVGEEALA